MPDFAEKFNISPERMARIKAERERLEPLRNGLASLLETYSLLDVYGELSHLLFDSCAHTVANADEPGQFRDCVRFVKFIAREAIGDRDVYWRTKLEATIDEGAIIGGSPFLVQALMEIVSAIQVDCRTMNARLGAIVAEEHWYKAQMRALRCQCKEDA